jgi:3',5'-cyclic AMP phosphodiesterase CpdA
MIKKTFGRRNFLKLAGLTTLGAVSACVPSQIVETAGLTATTQPTAASITTKQKNRVLRIAHMTDFHVEPEGISPAGMARALHHAQSQADPPDIILNTGDSIFDGLETSGGKALGQWLTYTSIMKNENSLSVIHAIGNHDVWGWGMKDPSIEKDPLYGKEMALERLGLANRYYSFDRAGWHFIVLDSIHTRNEVSPQPYIGKLDQEQFQWLKQDIEAVPQSTPICIASHIPLLAACEYFDGPNEDGGEWVVPACWMHIDARDLRRLFLDHPNVRLCLSGHTHQYEVLDYLGVRYQTNGAICGNWWYGWYMSFPPAYVMVNLYDVGSSDSQFVPYEEFDRNYSDGFWLRETGGGDT